MMARRAENAPSRSTAALAASFDTKLHVVHALDVPAPDGTGGPLADTANHTASMAEAAAQRIQDRADAFLSAEVAGVQVELGRPHWTLIRAARSLGADLILLGPHTKQRFFDLGGTQRSIFS
ncbi:MAG: universal stress protein, partial [Planctomycetota bacterium]